MCFRGDELAEEVRRRIAADPVLSPRVTLLGEIKYPKIEMYLQASDFLLQGSHQEGGGSGVIEALACGTTPLVTDIPSFRRITGDGQFGSLVPIGDSAALAQELVTWSRRDRSELRQSARRHFERSLSFKAIGEQLREAYSQVRRIT
jgi:glycosyltransferase involved in cell wall biosynthesis